MTDGSAAAEKPRPQFLDRAMLRSSASHCIIDGLWVGAYRGEAEPGLERACQALTLIKTFDPLRYRRLLQDLERIWIKLLPGSIAMFDEALWACKLDDRFVLDAATTIEQIASAIVHEATHARLARRGIGYAEPVRHRVEALCLQSEMAFANRLPDSGPVWEQANSMLSLCGNADHWSDAAFQARYRTEMKEIFRYLGMPEIMIRILDVTYGWRVAVRRFIRGLKRGRALNPARSA